MSSSFPCGCGAAGCGCCAGIQSITPKPVANPPGAAALSVRIGRHGDFLDSMLADLSTHRLQGGGAPLARLRTREGDDLTISLLDGFAAAGDVLTFYNERVANEGYLQTATHFSSVEGLARLVGYRPQPGVAASVYLAFGIDPNTTSPVRIDRGFGVKTVPGQDELPQIFETSEDLETRAGWNDLKLRKTLPQLLNPVKPGALWLSGTETALKIGDALLIELEPQSAPHAVRVVEVLAQPDSDRTHVRFEPWLSTVDDARLAELIAQGSSFGGVHAPAVLEKARQLQASPRVGASEPLKAMAADARSRMASLNANPEIKALLGAIADRAEELAAELAQPTGTTPPAQSGLAVPFVDRLKRLSARPAAVTVRTPRTAPGSFQETSAAALDVVARTAPNAGAQLAGALAGYRGAAPEPTVKVYAMRVRAGVFGRTFPKRMGPGTTDGVAGGVEEIGEWPIVTGSNQTNFVGLEQPDLITLDAVHEGIAPGSWMIVDMRGLPRPSAGEALRVGPTAGVLVTRAQEVQPKIARADYGGSGETTAVRIASDAPWIEYSAFQHIFNSEGMTLQLNEQSLVDREFQLIRRTTVYAAPEELELAQQPIDEPFCLDGRSGLEVELDAFYAGLEPGRRVIVSGERTDIPETEGVFGSEVAIIAGVRHDIRRSSGMNSAPLPGERIHTFITFGEPLSYCYSRSSVRIYGNVVKATHGETRREVLGGGDASKPNLAFTLKQAPLTFVAAATARGAEAALEVWVDDIRWYEREDLIDAGATDRAYVLATSAGGVAEIRFGDGHEGARPSTGTQNVRAVYRTGIGRPGNARAGQINQLVSRPAGLNDVVNPLPASGGADAEDRDQVRRNAPLATMALDRLVSVEDHASFARNFAGIAKARARLMTDGARRFVHLTVAAEDDAPLDSSSDLMIALKKALVRYGDPYSPVLLAPRELRLLILSAYVKIEPDRLWEPVAAEARRRLGERFGFDRRDIAAGLAPSEIVAVIQGTPGVAYVDLDTFGSIPTVGGNAGERAPLPPDVIAAAIEEVAENGVSHWEAARPARPGTGGMLAAELLLLAPEITDTLILNELK